MFTGVVMLSARAEALVRDEQATRSDSMTLNLRKWLGVMDTYVAGGFSYYTTMPTDCLRLFRDAAFETREYGEFIFILVWALRLTSCFVHRIRRCSVSWWTLGARTSPTRSSGMTS